jgi:CubicO group peptidase (beta-lactamase class C family)
MFEESLRMVEKGVRQNVFPSAALAVGVGNRVLVRGAWGYVGNDGAPVPATEETLYDLASLSKIVGTSMVAFRMMKSGRLRLTDRLENFFDAPADKRNVTVFQLMTHTGGISPFFFLSREATSPGDAVLAILNHPLAAKPGTQTIYSCMGYILIGKIIEKIGGAPLDRLARELVFRPLGMEHTCYCPATGQTFAATEYDPAAGACLSGVVHDENARFLGGVSGNAGVFSTLNDMERFASMLACCGGGYLSQTMFAQAVRNYTAGMTQNRGLGFQMQGTGAKFMGVRFGDRSFGHTGFTGTSLVVDPDSGLFAVLLTNRICPTRENNALLRFRGALHDCIAEEYAAYRRK